MESGNRHLVEYKRPSPDWSGWGLVVCSRVLREASIEEKSCLRSLGEHKAFTQMHLLWPGVITKPICHRHERATEHIFVLSSFKYLRAGLRDSQVFLRRDDAKSSMIEVNR